MHSAQRTLVKSPPELRSEGSDAAALARRLERFGELRITRLEAEDTVAWEGDRARGTVVLEPSGWGTKVTLTAEEPESAPEAVSIEAEREPEPEPEPEPDPVAITEPESEPEAEAEAAPRERRGRFTWLFRRRRRADEPAPAPETAEGPAPGTPPPHPPE